MTAKIVYAAVITTKHGTDVSGVYDTADDALGVVASFCRDWWSDAAEQALDHEPYRLDENGDLPVPETDRDVVETYFHLVEDESYDITQTGYHPHGETA